MSRTLTTAVLATALLVAALPGTALAGVHVDPEGPAGKQYSDSLAQARVENGQGDPTAAVPGSEVDAPLFGEGITDNSGGGGSGSDGSGGSGGASEDGGPSAVSDQPPGIDAGSDGGGTGFLAAAVGAVLLLGAGLGFGIRRLGDTAAA